MSGRGAAPAGAFSAQWLHLREPADRMARDAAAEALWGPAALAEAGAAGGLPLASHGTGPLTVFDLGCGTGATLRALAPRLGGRQHWHAWDHDEALLGAWPAALAAWAQREGAEVVERGGLLVLRGRGFEATVERHRVDLARGLGTLPFAEAGLVCATALLDLVSHDWLAALVGHLRPTSAPLSFALVVDGRIEWNPALPGDGAVARSFAEHQGRDKGFGPALGPRAPQVARDLLEAAGYVVRTARSDWLLAGGPLQAAVVDGMAAAACEQDPQAAADIERWRTLRAAAVATTHLRVGHVDLFAVRPGRA